MNISDRVSKLEVIAEAPAMEPIILYGHWTAEQCARLNGQHVAKNNPLPPMVCRPVAERVKHESND